MKFNSLLNLAGAIACAVGVGAAPAPAPAPVPAPSVRGKPHGSSSAAGQNVIYNTHWSGAVWNGQGVYNVQGSFVIPEVSGQNSQESVAIWVGIDGAGSGQCGNTLMQAGILLYGDGSIAPWYEWWPGEDIQYFSEYWEVQAGDNIFMQVQANSTTTGVAYITNQRTGNTLTHEFYSQESPSPLCEINAEWVIEAISFGNGNFATLPNFGTITITDTLANTGYGTVTASDAGIWDMSGYGYNNVNCRYAGQAAISCTKQ